MAIEIPNRLEMNMVIGPQNSVADLIQFAQDVIYNADGFVPDHWAVMSENLAETELGGAKRDGAMPADIFETLGAEALQDGFVIRGNLGGLVVIAIGAGPNQPGELTYGNTAGWRLFDTNFTFGENADEFEKSLEFCVSMFSQAAKKLDAVQGELVRKSFSYIGPEPPHSYSDALLHLVSTDLVALDYDDPENFYAQWDLTEYLGAGRALVSRGVDLVDETAFKKLTATRGIALCQAAKPQRCEIAEPDPNEAEREMIEDLPSYLEQVGFDRSSKTLEFSAMVPEEENLTIKDLLMILDFLENGTGGGDSVEHVYVTFLDETAAQNQLRLLDEIGVKVQYMTDDADWKVLNP